MNTIIVCGLLGAGKTTFIQQLTRTLRGKTVVLVNDFGKVGIDGEILSADGIEAIELPSGCICCTLKFDLITTIQKAMDNFSPDTLVIEPSGVASPSGVIEALEIVKLRAYTVVGIVDAAEFVELHEMEIYGNFFRDQIVLSDVVLINKTDLADETLLTRTEQLIGSLNPNAVLLRTVNAEMPTPLEPASNQKERHPAKKTNSHFNFETFSLQLERPDYKTIELLFNDLASGKYGEVVRAKALARTDRGAFRFDLSYGKIDAAAFPGEVETGRVVVIGTGLKKAELQKALAR